MRCFRDEHCPPHVHVAGKEWDARFRFSFLDGHVALWDVGQKIILNLVRAPGFVEIDL